MISMDSVRRSFVVLEVDEGFILINSMKKHGERIVNVSAHATPNTVINRLFDFFGPSATKEPPKAS